MSVCLERVGPIWKDGGEVCVCSEPHGHGADTASPHRCSCGTWWYDDAQIAAAHR